jgi:hypothetical protein
MKLNCNFSQFQHLVARVNASSVIPMREETKAESTMLKERCQQASIMLQHRIYRIFFP